MKKLFFVFVVGVVCLLASCAKQGYPSGGPRDVTPPSVVTMQPATGTTYFSARSFSIMFDEYVVLNDAENNIIVSPPIQPKPQYTIKGKSLVVDLPDTLKSDATYLFQMHGAVADFTEGNRVGPLEYAFSTGDVIDSLSLQGVVLDAYSGTPLNNIVTVLLYCERNGEKWNDSMVVYRQPDYVARCDEKGRFRFNYMADGSYHVFALNDVDRNLRYNGNEAMAFLDSLIQPVYMPKLVADSGAAPVMEPPVFTLMLSKDSLPLVQRVVKSEFLAPSRMVVVTSAPMLQPHVWCADSIVWSLSGSADTLNVWLYQPFCDTETLIVSDASGIDDTLKLRWHKKGLQRLRRDGSSLADTVPHLQANFLFDQKMGVFDTLFLSFNNPVVRCADTALQLLNLTDSVRTTVRLHFDSLSLRAWIDTTLAGDNKYVCSLAEGALTDIWGSGNSRVESTVEIQSIEKYGSIFVTCHDSIPANIIVQLVNEQGKVIRSIPWRIGQQRIAFEYLIPGKYTIQSFCDWNGDGQWTAGNYWQHRQPEPVYRMGKTINVRENWDIEETWQMLR